jgi:multisubunit Na+/H+ antiporter MnhC subunit
MKLRSHTSRSLFNGLLSFLLPFGLQFFIIHDTLLGGTLFTCCIHFLLQSCFSSKIWATFNSLMISVFVLLSAQVHPVVLLVYLISTAVILLESLALNVQFSNPSNKAWRAIVLYNFVIAFFRFLWSKHFVKKTCYFQTVIQLVVCFLLGNSPASEFYVPTFRNTLSVPSS